MHSPQSNSNRRTVVLPSPIHTALLNNPLHTPADNTTTPTPTRSTTNPIPIAIPPNPPNPPQPHSSHSSGPSSAKAFLMAMGMTSPVGIQTQHQQHPNPTPSNWIPASQNSSLSFSSPASQLSRTRSWNVVYPPQNLNRHKSASSTTNAYSTGSPFAKSRTNSVSDFCHSASSQSSQPQSPAASFLSSFTERASISPRSGEEGEEVGGYVLGKVLGTGMFSVVRKAFTMRDQLDKIKVVAVKIIKKEADTPETDSNSLTRTANVGRNGISDESSGSQSLSETFLDRELDIWRQLDHPNLLKMIEVVDHPQATFIFCDFCPGGDMLTYLRRKGKPGLPEPEAARLWTQLASAVLYLHEILRVVHRDIKLENILLSETGDLKLGDFGFADYSHQKDRLAIAIPVTMGSLAYCAPELVRCDKTSTTDSPASIPTKLRAGDCWALGVILFAFITGSLPFADEFEPRMILKISNVQYAWSTTSVAPSSTPPSDTNPSAGSTGGIEAPSAPPTPLPHQQSTNSLSSPVSASSFSADSSFSSSGLSDCTLFLSAPSPSVPVDRQSCRTDPRSMGSPLVRSLVAGLFNIKWWERWSVRMALESSWVRSFRV